MQSSRYSGGHPPGEGERPSGDARRNFAIQPAENAGNVRLKKSSVKVVRPAASTQPGPPTPAVASPTPAPPKLAPLMPAPAAASQSRAQPVRPVQPFKTATINSPPPASAAPTSPSLDSHVSANPLQSSSLARGQPASISASTSKHSQALNEIEALARSLNLGYVKPAGPTGSASTAPKSKPAREESKSFLQDYIARCETRVDTSETKKLKTESEAPDAVESLPSTPKLGTASPMNTRRLAFGKRPVGHASSLASTAKPLGLTSTTTQSPAKTKSVPEPFVRSVPHQPRISQPPELTADLPGVPTKTSAIITASSPPKLVPEAPVKPMIPAPQTTPSRMPFVDPMEKITSWPTQEKREKTIGNRVAMLKGIPSSCRVHDVQCIVWGGALESIKFDSAKNVATARFLTAEACQKYLDETANGIEIPGKNKLVIFVDQSEGPNSSNDVINAAATQGQTRCVRALHANLTWNDGYLKKLAEGESKTKRLLDVIKRGKTPKHVNYIEFRFTNLNDALNFMRDLRNDQDWEECNILFAEDPCEIARGVHFNEVTKADRPIYG